MWLRHHHHGCLLDDRRPSPRSDGSNSPRGVPFARGHVYSRTLPRLYGGYITYILHEHKLRCVVIVKMQDYL